MQNIKIMSKLKGLVSVIVVLAMFIIMGRNNIVYAASATVNISTSSVTQGKEVNVTVTISADSNIGAYNFYLEYDASVLEAVSGFEGGGGGRVQLIYDVPDEASLSKKLTKTVKFKAIAPGKSDIKYVCINSDDGVIDYDTIDNMSVTANNGTVTVNPPVVASKNNNLSSMTVAAVRADGSSYNVPLSPSFSKDVTKYNITVEEGVTDLVVAAKTEDAKAKIYVQWPNLDPGDNVTKVIVTAENGSKKEYVINTKVPVPETTTPAPVEPITTVVDGVEYFIENVNDAVTLPEGFEASDYDYNGKKVVVGKGLVKELIVMYLTTGNGEAGKLFIYDEVNNSFYPMANVAMSQKLYTIVKAPNGLIVPEGFVQSVLTIDGVELTGWKTDEVEGIYLVYAMNWEGKTGLYFYDTSESQMIKYFEMSAEVGVGLDDYNSLVSENESLKSQLAKKDVEKEETDDSKVQLYKYIVFIALAVIVILVGVIILILLKKKKDEIENEDDRIDAMDNAFASIISKEEAAAKEAEMAESQSENASQPEVLPEVLPEGAAEVEEDFEVPAEVIAAEVVEALAEEAVSEVVEETAEAVEETTAEVAEVAIEETAEETAAVVAEVVTAETIETSAEENVEVIEQVVEDSIVSISEETIVAPVVVATEDETKDTVTEENSNIAVEETVSETAEETFDDVDLTLENELKNAVADIFEEETTEAEESTSNNSDSVNKNDEKSENKERVARILQDENTSIKEDELDMVIDELFDDLFGE